MRYLWCLVLVGVALGQSTIGEHNVRTWSVVCSKWLENLPNNATTDTHPSPCYALAFVISAQNRFTYENITVLLAQLPDRIPERKVDWIQAPFTSYGPPEPIWPTSATITDFHAIDALGRHCYAEDQHPVESQDDSHICTGSCMTYLHPPMPIVGELVDVPAIQEGKETCVEVHYDGGYYYPSDNALGIKPGDKLCYGRYWTCADKSRILLTSENGRKHCVKF